MGTLITGMNSVLRQRLRRKVFKFKIFFSNQEGKKRSLQIKYEMMNNISLTENN